jgi:hypothetical protein
MAGDVFNLDGVVKEIHKVREDLRERDRDQQEKWDEEIEGLCKIDAQLLGIASLLDEFCADAKLHVHRIEEFWTLMAKGIDEYNSAFVIKLDTIRVASSASLFLTAVGILAILGTLRHWF